MRGQENAFQRGQPFFCPLAQLQAVFLRHLYIAEHHIHREIYRNAAALCILQIGELVGKLTEDFRDSHDAIPWRKIKAMRNIVAHSYGTVDSEITWEIIKDGIPELKAYCLQVLSDE